MFDGIKLRRRLKRIGSSCDTSYMLYVNNDEPCVFPSRSDVESYLSHYRSENIIFKLQIYRIETYSL